MTNQHSTGGDWFDPVTAPETETERDEATPIFDEVAATAATTAGDAEGPGDGAR